MNTKFTGTFIKKGKKCEAFELVFHQALLKGIPKLKNYVIPYNHRNIIGCIALKKIIYHFKL